MKVIGIVPTDKLGACETYRVSYPLRAMEELGHRTAVYAASDAIRMVKDGVNPFAHVDLAIFQRITAGVEGAWDRFLVPSRAIGCSMVVDYDDDYTNKYRAVSPNGVKGLDKFSAITVSTPYLAEVMRPFNDHIEILPNMLVPEIINRGFDRVIPELTIGLTGSTTHEKDWQAVYNPLRRISTEFPHVKIFCSGFVPEQLRDLPNLVTMRDFVPDPQDQWNFFIPIDRYGFILRNIDIGLVPVAPDDLFNHSKSNLKAIEMQASVRPDPFGAPMGVSVIATGGALPNYKKCIQSGLNGTLISNHYDENEWYNAIRRNIVDVEWRLSVQRAGYKSCMRDWNIHAHVRERVAAYTRIIERDRRNQTKLEAMMAVMA